MAKRHTRSASSSDILVNETVSALRRFVFGNFLRTQRQLAKFVLFVSIIFLCVYMIGPLTLSAWKPTAKVMSDSKAANVVHTVTISREVQEHVEESEYRATFFEEMGRKIAGKKISPKEDDTFMFDWKTINNKRSNDGSNKTVMKQHFSLIHPDHKTKKMVTLPKTDTKIVVTRSRHSNAPVNSRDDFNGITERVKVMAEKMMQCRQVPGMAVALVRDNNFAQIPLGWSDISTRKAVTADTRFLLNSISKTFLGQLLAVLISQTGGKLTWDTKVVDILGPSLELATEYLTREITLRDLLSHRSGLSSGNLAVRATFPEEWAKQDVVSRLKHLPVSSPFRKSFLYSNIGGILLAHVAEILGGASWDKLVVDFLLGPLGMLDSKPITQSSELLGTNFSRLYVPIEGNLTLADYKIFEQGPLAPVALLSTTASDMTKWLQFNLRKGCLPSGKELIHPDLWAEMWQRQTDLSPMFLAGVDKSGSEWPVGDYSLGYGLFWFINRYRGLTYYWHGGGLYTHYTLAWHFPDKDVALYIVINGYSGDASAFSVVEGLSYYAADVLLGYQPWLNENTLCSYPQPWLKNFTGNKTTPRLSTGNVVQAATRSSLRNSETPLLDQLKQSKSIIDISNVSDSAKGQRHSGSAFLGIWRPDKEDRKSTDILNTKLSQFGFQQGNHLRHSLQYSRFLNSSSEILGSKPDNMTSEASNDSVRSVQPLLASYQGLYFNPLFGNFSVSLDESKERLVCNMRILTGVLHPQKSHTFGVELTGSLRFLSKPSAKLEAKDVFMVDFVENSRQEITSVNIHSSWPMEVPLNFIRIR